MTNPQKRKTRKLRSHRAHRRLYSIEKTTPKSSSQSRKETMSTSSTRFCRIRQNLACRYHRFTGLFLESILTTTRAAQLDGKAVFVTIWDNTKLSRKFSGMVKDGCGLSMKVSPSRRRRSGSRLHLPKCRLDTCTISQYIKLVIHLTCSQGIHMVQAPWVRLL